MADAEGDDDDDEEDEDDDEQGKAEVVGENQEGIVSRWWHEWNMRLIFLLLRFPRWKMSALKRTTENDS